MMEMYAGASYEFTLASATCWERNSPVMILRSRAEIPLYIMESQGLLRALWWWKASATFEPKLEAGMISRSLEKTILKERKSWFARMDLWCEELRLGWSTDRA
jgi:hypothetical protein